MLMYGVIFSDSQMQSANALTMAIKQKQSSVLPVTHKEQDIEKFESIIGICISRN